MCQRLVFYVGDKSEDSKEKENLVHQVGTRMQKKEDQPSHRIKSARRGGFYAGLLTVDVEYC